MLHIEKSSASAQSGATTKQQALYSPPQMLALVANSATEGPHGKGDWRGALLDGVDANISA